MRQDRPLTSAAVAGRSAWGFAGYLVALGLAETLVLVSPAVALAALFLIAMALLTQASLGPASDRPLLVGLTLSPLQRILSLSFPLAPSPIAWRYGLTGVSLLAGAWWAARVLGLSWEQVGVRLRRPLLQLAIVGLGLPAGLAAYLALPATGLVSSLAWPGAIAVGLVMLGAGLVEEFVFRGVLLAAARQVLGRLGIVYSAAVSAASYIGYRSLALVGVVLVVSLAFAWLVARTRSLWGVAMAHGVANVLALVVLPVVWA